MNQPVGTYNERRIDIDGIVPKPIQRSAVWSALGRTMRYFRRKPGSRNIGWTHRRPVRGEMPLRTASLGSPIFVESWNGGSPLNWFEFMGRWEIRRADSARVESED